MTKFDQALDEMSEEEAAAEGRLVLEAFDSAGNLVKRSVGPSTIELLALHRDGKCHVTCSWCHQALAEKVGEDAAVASMYDRSFGRPMPSKTH